MKRAFFLIIILLFCFKGFAYEHARKPFKAAVYSLVFPGGGQYYNKSNKKFIFTFALESALIGVTFYHIYKSEDYYKKYKHSFDTNYYQKYLDYYYKRQNDLWWLGAIIALSMIDAYVDAHLVDFDEVRNKIHLKFCPKMISLQYNF